MTSRNDLIYNQNGTITMVNLQTLRGGSGKLQQRCGFVLGLAPGRRVARNERAQDVGGVVLAIRRHPALESGC